MFVNTIDEKVKLAKMNRGTQCE